MSRILGALLFLPLLMTLLPALAPAQAQHQLIRRVVVFPTKVDAPELSASADEAWWQAREELTRSRRFLVASRQFMVQKDVFMPRGSLQPADAIILGKLLDAHAMVVSELKDRTVTMTVYDGANGTTLWEQKARLHPSILIREQLPKVARNLIRDFIAMVPYQGFQVIDPLIGKAIYEEGDVRLSQVDVGVESDVQIGDSVQWITIESTNAGPLFQGGGRVTVIAEGKVVKLDQGLATVEVLRATDVKKLVEYSIVRVPREYDRLRAEYALKDTVTTVFSPEVTTVKMMEMENRQKEVKPLATTIAFLSSVAAFLLLAF